MSQYTYQSAGVNIDAGDALVEKIKPLAKRTAIPGVLGAVGGFGGLFEIPWQDYKNPVLVSGTDGVGTKLKLAQQLGIHHTIGIDLVAMCVNDIIVSGAKPLFFLDYFATGKLIVNTAEQVIQGIAAGCELAGCALIGGETAEMPGMYHDDEYDLAGFSVGIVEKSAIIDGQTAKVGDVLIGLASSGFHSNGYSLVRKVITDEKIDLQMSFEQKTLGEALLKPTFIYVKTLQKLLAAFPVKAIAHITGGGITENLPRVLRQQVKADIKMNSWEMPAIFSWLKNRAALSWPEMLRTFNSGIGMILVVDKAIAAQVVESITDCQAWIIGELSERIGSENSVVYRE